MKIRIKEILKYDPYPGDLGRLFARTGDDPETTMSLEEILDISGVEDAYWLLCCWPSHVYRPLLADVAELVLPAWTAAYPDDDRPRCAIDAARTGDAGVMASACDDARNAAWEAAWGDEEGEEEPVSPEAERAVQAARAAMWAAADPEKLEKSEATATSAVLAGATWQQLENLMRAWLKNKEKEV